MKIKSIFFTSLLLTAAFSNAYAIPLTVENTTYANANEHEYAKVGVIFENFLLTSFDIQQQSSVTVKLPDEPGATVIVYADVWYRNATLKTKYHCSRKMPENKKVKLTITADKNPVNENSAITCIWAEADL